MGFLRSKTLYSQLIYVGLCLTLLYGIDRYFAQKAAKDESILSDVLPLLKADSKIGWRQKSFFSGHLARQSIRTNQLGLRGGMVVSPDILVLGPSSTFGWGVSEDETYSRQLETRLSQSGINLKVVNAGQIGFSSWQGVRLFKELLELGWKPKALVLAYGVNDVDRFRFYFSSGKSDASEFATEKSKMSVLALNQLQPLQGFGFLARRLKVWLGGYYCQDGTQTPVRRVPSTLSNFEKILQLATENSIRVIAMTTPHKFNTQPTKLKNLSLFDSIKSLYESGEIHQALSLYELKGQFVASGRLHYQAQLLYRKMGECDKAQEAFARARQGEVSEIQKALVNLNGEVRTWARSYQIPLVDAERLLKPTSGSSSFFVDPVHPSAKGHKILAGHLFKSYYHKKYGKR